MRFVLLFLLFATQVSAQNLNLRIGMVIDSLPVNDSIEESYALYLPTSFKGNNPMPVIFVFDPLGRGKTAAQLFKPTAEKQGYIIVSSNNIKPGKTLEENVLTAARLIAKVTAIIPVDYNSISVAGFAEGAKVATSLPLVFNTLYGILAVGDQQINFERMGKENPFMFVGVAGDEQFSMYNMGGVVQKLKEMGFPTVLYTFNGGSEWPNAGIISIAVGSLSLHAMEKKLRPLNKSLVDYLYEQDLDRVNKLISNQKYIAANRFLELLGEKYEGLADLSEIKEKQKHLKNTRNYNEQQAAFDLLREQEFILLDDYIYFYTEDIATSNFENLGWWDFQKLKLVQYTQSENEAEVDMGNRLIGLMRLLSKEKINQLNQENAPLEKKLLAYMLLTIFDQHNFDAYKNIISLSAIDGDYGTALFYLEEMLKNGFEDKTALYNIKGTLGLKLTPEYNHLIEKYLGEAKYYNIPE